MFLVAVVTGLWIAVGWHRFVLLGEAPGIVPVFRGDRIWAYFLRSLGYGIILVVAAVLCGGIVVYVLRWVLMFSWGMALNAMAVLVYPPLLVIAFRLTTGLPGAALGADAPFLAGWNATAGKTGDFIGLALVIVVIIVVLELIGFLVISRIMVLSLIWSFLIGWLRMILGVSILTTLYGHYIEKRELV